MIVDRLVLHHTYEGATAFDVSQHHHHGALEHVGSGGGTVHFSGGPGCVRVKAGGELSTLRAVRTTVRFRWQPTGPARRHNLIEGYLSFALVIDPDGSLHGTILDRSGTWAGARSVPGIVTPGTWHTATWVHDGISGCRLDLDGTPVAEAYDVLGPVHGVQPLYGLAIGHWPDPDDRYSFEGEIDDVRVWIDRPDAGRDLADPCCCDHREEADRAFDRLRDEDFDAAAYRSAADQLYDLGSRVFGQMASGTQADRDHAHHLARRFAMAVETQDRQSLGTTIADAAQLAQARIPAAELDADAAQLKAALDQTILGPVLDAVLGGGAAATPEGLSKLFEKLGIDAWIRGFCAGWVVPPRPREPRDEPQRHPDHSRDPATDHRPDEPPPGWGGDGEHDDGDDRGGEPAGKGNEDR